MRSYGSRGIIKKVSVVGGMLLAVGLIVGCSASAGSKKDEEVKQTNVTIEQDEKFEYEIGKSHDIGKGSKEFTIKIISQSDKVTTFNVKTDKEMIGEALQELGIIDGEEGPYGITLQEACGEKHVYEETGSYWSLYINNLPATTGVDTTKIDKNKEYKLVAEEE